MLERCRIYLDGLAGLESITVLEAGEEPPKSAVGLLGAMKILIPLAGLIDTEAETARLTREIHKQSKELDRSEQKLANPNFVDRAPAAVVDKERARAESLRADIGRLEAQLESLGGL